MPGQPVFRTGEGAAPGAASTFGTEQQGGAGASRTPPTSFSIPGAYGRSGRTFVVGEGRLARPKFRYHGNVSMGYDDNVFQTPTHGQSQRPQKIDVLETPGTPEQTVFVEVPSGDPLVPASIEQVTIPATEPKFRTVRIPGVQAPERVGSLVTRSTVGFDIQIANRRNLFTFDFDGGGSYYWNRPGKKIEYNGSLAMIYLRKLSGRAQFTFTIDGQYQTQPDYSQVSAPTRNNRGSYITAHAKADLSYRLTPRFSTVTSVGYNTLRSMESQQQAGDYNETTFGTELRYLFSPRLTLLGELRYSSSMHDQDSAQDTNSYYLLIGGELTLSRRFTASLRVGENLQMYTDSGRRSSSPYLETTLSYRLARGTSIEWNARYGFEESGSANSESLVARTGLSLTHIFSPRLQGSLSMNLIHNETTSEAEVLVETPVSDPADPSAQASTTPDSTSTNEDNSKSKASSKAKAKTKKVSTESVTDTVDATVGLRYTFSRHWAFNLNYTYTLSLGPIDTADFYRQQIFLGAEFTF